MSTSPHAAPARDLSPSSGEPEQGALPAEGSEERDPDQPTRVLRQFRQVFNAVKTHFQQVEKVVGVGGTQVWAMSVIRERPGIGVGELARSLDVRQPTASNVVRQLVEQGLVEVRKEGADRRAVQLYLLPAGQVLVASAPGPLTGVLPLALSKMEPETLARLEADLQVLLAEIGTSANAARIPLADM